MKKHLLILLLISGADFAAGYNPNLVDDIIITPPNPTELDEISVTVWFSGGPFVNTHWNIIDGNTVRIRMVKDGLDLAPNPPSVFVEKINPLPEGTYNFIIEVEHYFSDDLMTETKVVSVGPAFHAIPSGSPTSLIVLIALLGVLAVMNHITKR